MSPAAAEGSPRSSSRILIGAAGLAHASETVDAARPIGHPRARFPLAVHLVPPPDAALEAPVRRAMDDWNAVAREALGIEAFRWGIARRAPTS